MIRIEFDALGSAGQMHLYRGLRPIRVNRPPAIIVSAEVDL